MHKMMAAVLTLCVAGTAARAQQMAIVMDQVMVMGLPNGESDTLDVHTISVGSRSRVDNHIRGGMLAQVMGTSSSEIVNADSGMTMIMLNNDRKTYFSFNPLGMVDSAGNILGGAGGQMKFELPADTATVDSLGPGPVIAGHPTAH